MLTGHKTKLSFNNFLSEFIKINNSNNQGCPLSMINYTFYNAGLLEIALPNDKDEAVFGFVDNVACLAIGKTFTATHRKLGAMMGQLGGTFDWLESHNSGFELTKLALMDYSPNPYQESTLTISHPRTNRSTTVKSVKTYQFLGVLFDPKLKWTAQTEKAARSAEAWINLVRQLARTSTGLLAKAMQQLYVAIAIPKMSYAVDVWYTHPHKANESLKKRTGSIKFIQKLQSVQRRATIAMLGAMRTTASDVLNAHAYLPPPHLLFLTTLNRSARWLVMLPNSHPLYKPSQLAVKRKAKQHHSPLHTLFFTTGIQPKNYEVILPTR